MPEPNRFYFATAMAQRLGRMAGVDLAARADILGADLSGDALLIPFFGSVHRVSPEGVTDVFGNPPTPAVGSLPLDYVLRAPLPPRHRMRGLPSVSIPAPARSWATLPPIPTS